MPTPLHVPAADFAASFTTSVLPSTGMRDGASATPAHTHPSESESLFPLAGTTSSPSEPPNETRESLMNYYFLILAAFGVLVVVLLYWLRQKRLKQKARLRMTGQTALARDLDGWGGGRRWVYGGYWRPNPNATAARREEGLNENGEAPPPYEPKTDAAVVVDERTGLPRDSATGVTIPMRTLSRGAVESHRPPDYHAVIQAATASPPSLPSPTLAPPSDARVRTDHTPNPPPGRTASSAND